MIDNIGMDKLNKVMDSSYLSVMDTIPSATWYLLLKFEHAEWSSKKRFFKSCEYIVRFPIKNGNVVQIGLFK